MRTAFGDEPGVALCHIPVWQLMNTANGLPVELDLMWRCDRWSLWTCWPAARRTRRRCARCAGAASVRHQTTSSSASAATSLCTSTAMASPRSHPVNMPSSSHTPKIAVALHVLVMLVHLGDAAKVSSCRQDCYKTYTCQYIAHGSPSAAALPAGLLCIQMRASDTLHRGVA